MYSMRSGTADSSLRGAEHRTLACSGLPTALRSIVGIALSVAAMASAGADAAAAAPPAPFADFRHEAPGVRRKIQADGLPPPFATPSAFNPPIIVERPADAWPAVPAGFRVELYANDLRGPRVIRTAPNGDLFVAESDAGRIRVLRGVKPDGKARQIEIFAHGLNRPYGIAFYPPGKDPRWIYIGDVDSVIRMNYRSGDLHAGGSMERVAKLPGNGGHWTRDLQFSQDGRTLFVGVGSASNAAEEGWSGEEDGRSDILAFDADGSNRRVYASGLRNPSGLAIDPGSGVLWCIVNERDGLGDNLVPDFLTHVREGGFYGWPWWYLGRHQDPSHAGEHPELAGSVIVPDVLLQAHNASLQLIFYTGSQFPEPYRQDIFATAHGSWNRSVRAGYEVIRVPTDHRGHASGEYEDFMTGFVLADGRVWGRPVGIAVGADGALLVSDDASNSIWRVRYLGTAGAAAQ